MSQQGAFRDVILDPEHVVKPPLTRTTPLCTIALRHGTDKVVAIRHEYTKLYHMVLEPLRERASVVLEIGVGHNVATGKSGAGLYMLRDYFSKATVYGIDISTRCMFNDDRIHTHLVNASDPAALREFATEVVQRELDVVIDDGSHKGEFQIRAMTSLLPYLAPHTGVYIIQSVQPKTWEQFDYYFDEAVMEVVRGNGCVVEKVDLRPFNPAVFDDIVIIVRKEQCSDVRPVRTWRWKRDTMHVLMCTDAPNLHVFWTCVNSIVSNCGHNLECLKFCVLLDGCIPEFHRLAKNFLMFKIRKLTEAGDVDGIARFCSHFFDMFDIRALADYDSLFHDITYGNASKSYLANRSNYSRFILPHAFAHVNNGLYMDTDIICNNLDLTDIRQHVTNRCGISAADVRRHSTYNYALMMDLPPIVGEDWRRHSFFNAGVYYWNLSEYRTHNYLARVKEIIATQRNGSRLKFKLGTQPVLNILYYKNVHTIPAHWNITTEMVPSFERRARAMGDTLLTAPHMRHYTGEKKPWVTKLCPLWARYSVAV